MSKEATVTRQRRYSKEELARRGKALYESQIRPQVESNHFGRIVAIDIETGAFEVADNPLVASNRLLERYPDAQTWLIRIGHCGVDRFSQRNLQEWANRGDRAKYEAVLAKVPDVEPESFDQLPPA